MSFRHPGATKLPQKKTNPLPGEAGSTQQTSILPVGVSLSTTERCWPTLNLCFLHVQNDDFGISGLIFKENSCCGESYTYTHTAPISNPLAPSRKIIYSFTRMRLGELFKLTVPVLIFLSRKKSVICCVRISSA